MSAQAFAIDDPESWHIAAIPDKELDEVRILIGKIFVQAC